AFPVDDARNDFRRGSGRGDAFDRGGRAAKGDGFHRAAWRAQSDRGSQRSTKRAGISESPEKFTWFNTERLPGNSAECDGYSGGFCTQAFHADKNPSEASTGYAHRLWR